MDPASGRTTTVTGAKYEAPGSTQTPLDATRATGHTVGLTGLSPGTLYHYRVRSKDEAGNERLSADQTLTTPSGTSTIGITITSPLNNALLGAQ